MRRIDFYAFTQVNIYDYVATVEVLQQRGIDARIVIEPPSLSRSYPMIDGVRRRTVDEDMFASMVTVTLGLGQLPLLHARNDTADLVVTNAGVGMVSDYSGIKVRMQYGVGVISDSYSHGSVNAGFDAALTHGPLSASCIEQWIPRVFQVGFPKYVDDGAFDVSHWQRRWNLDPTKPTVVYCPTWANNSTIDQYASAVANLTPAYNVVVKPHVLAQRFESARFDVMRGKGVVVDEDTHTIKPFLQMADVVLADNRSGSFTEAIYLDKPVVALSSTGSLAGDKLLDIARDAALYCTDPEILRQLVDATVAVDNYEVTRRALRRELFAENENDAVAAADALVALLNERPVRADELRPSSHITTMVLHSATSVTDLLRCLDSLTVQNVDTSMLEVIAVSDVVPSRVAQLISVFSWPFTLTLVDNASLASTVSALRGRAGVIGFLNASAIAGEDYLELHGVKHGSTGKAVVTGSLLNGPTGDMLSAVMAAEFATSVVGLSLDNASFGAAVFDQITEMFRFESVAAASLELGYRVDRVGTIVDSTAPPASFAAPMSTSRARERTLELGSAIVELAIQHPEAEPVLTLEFPGAEQLSAFVAQIAVEASSFVVALENIGQMSPDGLIALGEQGTQIATLVDTSVQALRTQLHDRWLFEGAINALQHFGTTSLAEARRRSASTLGTRAGVTVIAWPAYEDSVELDELMTKAAAQCGGRDATLVLLHDDGDPSTSGISERVAAAFDRVCPDADLDVTFALAGSGDKWWKQVSFLADATIELPSSKLSAQKSGILLRR